MKNRIIIALLSCFAVSLFAGQALSSIIVSYDFTVNNANQADSPLAGASDTSAPWAGNFMGNVTSGAFRDTENNLIADNLGDALSGNRYVTFTVTPAEPIHFESFSVTLGGFNTTGTNYNVGLGVFSSLTGFSEAGDVLGTDSLFVPAGTGGIIDKDVPLNIDLTAFSGLQNINDPVEFRIYYMDDRASAHSGFNVRVRDISVEAVAVPEPGMMASAVGLLSLLWVLRRRRVA